MGCAADVLCRQGHDDVVNMILSHLDWRSVLAASQVSRRLNTVVQNSVTIQLELRRIYYRLSPAYLRFDQPVFAKNVPKAQRLQRMTDVFHRWQRVSPASVHRLSLYTPEAVVSHGLLALPMSDNGLEAEWNVPYPKKESAMFKPRSGPSSGWDVYDLHGLRDVHARPERNVPKWQVDVDHEFCGFAISREDNVVLTAEVVPQPDQFHQFVIRCYLLEPSDTSNWAEGETIEAIPHPGAAVLTLGGGPTLTGRTTKCDIQVGPGCTAKFSEYDGICQLGVWNWRTGEKVVNGNDLSFLHTILPKAPLTPDGVLHIRRVKDLCPSQSTNWTDILQFIPTGQLEPDGGITMGKEEQCLELVLDSCGALAVLRSEINLSSYTRVVHLQRRFLSSPPVLPNQDVRVYGRHPVAVALCGYRVVTITFLEGTITSRLFVDVDDFRGGQYGADPHFSPLGCPTSTKPVRPLPREPQKSQPAKGHFGGKPLFWECSDAWGPSEADSLRFNHPEGPHWPSADASLPSSRSTVEMAMEFPHFSVNLIRADMDADHLYLFTVCGARSR